MTGNHKVRVATAQYSINYLRSWGQLEAKLTRWVDEAASSGAQLLVFPEYGALELAGIVDQRTSFERRSPDRHLLGPLPVALHDRREKADLTWVTNKIQPLVADYLAFHASLAAQYRVHILAGSLPLRGADGKLRNTAFFFAPDGSMGSQDKIILTRWEREVWHMTGGNEVCVFDTEHGPIGIDICYDVEFPIIARRQAEAHARIILSPCCCDSLRGFYRVRVGARARALENQAYVVQAAVVGTADWLPAIDRCVGLAAIYTPPDLGPRENGIIAQGELNQPQWVYGNLDLSAIDRIRGKSTIANAEDWAAHIHIGAAVKRDLGAVAVSLNKISASMRGASAGG